MDEKSGEKWEETLTSIAGFVKPMSQRLASPLDYRGYLQLLMKYWRMQCFQSSRESARYEKDENKNWQPWESRNSPNFFLRFHSMPMRKKVQTSWAEPIQQNLFILPTRLKTSALPSSRALFAQKKPSFVFQQRRKTLPSLLRPRFNRQANPHQDRSFAI